MAAEIIDLTGSPPPPPPPPPSMSSPSILNFVVANSAEQVQFGNLGMPLWPNNNPNPNFPYTNQQQSTIWPTPMSMSGHAYDESTQLHIHQSIETQTQKVLTAPTGQPTTSGGHIYEPSQGATNFQPNNMDGDQVAIVLEPVLEANADPFPHGTRRRETWTPRDHELFMMGLNQYGRGRWTKIARHFLSNKTPQQVQSYANSFFKNLPTHFYNFRKRNNSAYSNASFSNVVGNNNGNNLIIGDASPYNNMIPNLINNANYYNYNYNDEPIRKTLMLFPEKTEPNNFSQVQFQPFDEASTTTTINNNSYGEVDLELRLGRGQ